MRDYLRIVCVLGVICVVLCQPVLAATAQAQVCAEVVDPVSICGSLSEASSRFGARLSATAPETISSPDTVAKFDVIGGKDSAYTILLPRELPLKDGSGRTVATCAFSSVIGQAKNDYSPTGVVIKANVRSLEQEIAPCSADFDVILAYD